MNHISIEIKAKSRNLSNIRRILKKLKADFKGVDHQIDTYFTVNHGRLKLREGNIENYLIHYDRDNKKGPKQSKVTLYPVEPGAPLKQLLIQSNGILTKVDKKREIYFIDNVKFHLDRVKGLGSFVEIEVLGVKQGLTKTML